MKLTVKTLKGSHFEIRVQPSDTIMAVKKNIEDVQGKVHYPCGQQLLIHNGKVLKDESTLAENKVSEDGFLVVMLSKTKTMTSSGAPSGQTPSTSAPASNPTPAPASNPTPAPASNPTPAPASNPTPVPASNPTPAPASNPTPAPQAPAQAVATKAASSADVDMTNNTSQTYDQAASMLVSGNSLEQTIQQIMDMGGGNWDKETVTRALRAAYNNPERAVDYLYSGIPETREVVAPVAHLGANQTTGVNPNSETGAPNSSPLNLFPQEAPPASGGGGLGSLDFLRNNQQFQALRAMVQANPQILQPILQELGKQNPQLLRLIQEHHTEFLQLINEPVDGSDGDFFEQGDQEMPHAINVTPAEQEAIERLVAMGFDRALVIEAFLACDRNEELAINYLLENSGEFED